MRIAGSEERTLIAESLDALKRVVVAYDYSPAGECLWCS